MRASRPKPHLSFDPPTRCAYALSLYRYRVAISLQRAARPTYFASYDCAAAKHQNFGALPGKMRVVSIASALLGAASVVYAEARTADLHIQPLGSSSSPVLLAGLTYDSSAPDTASSASVTSYESPELPDSTDLVRVGIYDSSQKQWVGSTSVASAENFRKGYSPHFVLSVDGTSGEEVVLGASVRGVRIDAGQTRDFGPQASLLLTSRGKQPDLNKPIVLSPEGKKVEKEEKTFLQKFVPAPRPSLKTADVVMALHWSRQANHTVKILVDDRHRHVASYGRRRRRGQIDVQMAQKHSDDKMRDCCFGVKDDDVTWGP